MTNAVIQPSFGAGELSPSLYGRVDLAKYHSGAALLRNFFVDYRGGASTRFGSSFVGQCKDSSTANRLIPFQFSTVQTYALVFGNLTMRVAMDGAYVTEPSTPISAVSIASTAVLTDMGHGYSTGDLVFLQSLGGMTSIDEKFGVVQLIDANNFSLLDMFGSPISTAGLPAYTGGGIASRVFTLVTPYAAADLALLKFSQSADTMTLTHPNYPAQDLTRSQHWIWVIAPINFEPTTSAPTNVVVTGAGGATVYDYVVTALSKSGTTESFPSGNSFSSVPLSTTSGAKNVITWSGNPGDTLYNIYRTPENIGGSPDSGALLGFIGSVSPSTQNSFTDNNILPDFTRTPPLANNPFAIGAIETVSLSAHGHSYTAPSIHISDPTGSGAVVTAQLSGGGPIASIVVIDGGQGYTAPTFTISDSTGTGAVISGATLSTTNNPFCSTYFQQRQIFGGQTESPEALVFSKTGDFHNLSYSTPQRDDDAIQATISSQTVNAIKHMIPLNSLVVLTGSGAWRVDGGSQSDTITPSHLVAVPQAYNGCSDVPPLVINYDILYVQAKGSIVRDLSYNFYVNVYTGTDISMLSNHLFFGHQITEWCWAEEPFKIVWAVRDDGILLSLTYLKEQDVSGWARHDTQGLYKSICSISEGNENAVYVIVERTVQGQSVQYIERFVSRDMGGDGALGIPADVTKAWCVDCGLQYSNATPTSVVSGLDHLEGQTVVILADGNVQPTQVVSGGAVSLQHAANVVTVGLGYTAQLQSLYLDVQEPGGTIQSKRKKINAVTARVQDSRGLKAGPSFTSLTEIKERSTENMGQAIALFTGDRRVIISPVWTVQGQICLQQDWPLPATVLALIPEINIGDN